MFFHAAKLPPHCVKKRAIDELFFHNAGFPLHVFEGCFQTCEVKRGQRLLARGKAARGRLFVPRYGAEVLWSFTAKQARWALEWLAASDIGQLLR